MFKIKYKADLTRESAIFYTKIYIKSLLWIGRVAAHLCAFFRRRFQLVGIKRKVKILEPLAIHRVDNRPSPHWGDLTRAFPDKLLVRCSWVQFLVQLLVTGWEAQVPVELQHGLPKDVDHFRKDCVETRNATCEFDCVNGFRLCLTPQ